MADKPNVDEQTTSTSPVENNAPVDTSASDSAHEGSQPQDDDSEATDGGGAQTRIRKLSRDKKTLIDERNYWRDVATRYAQTDARVAQSTQIPETPSYPNEEVERAFRTLKDRGMVTKEELENSLLRVQWDREHDRNENEVNKRGTGLPAYDRFEVEEYARKKGISDPMTAYRDLYFDEILDATRKGNIAPRNQVPSQKPTKPTAPTQEPIDVEALRAKLNGPDGRAYYEELAKDPRKFDEVLQALSK